MIEKMQEIRRAWELLGCILTDDCRIYSERFFRGGHNSLLPFVHYLYLNPQVTNDNKKRIVVGSYLSIMSGVFAGAEARMSSFTRNIDSNSKDFPLKQLADLVKRQYGIDSLDKLLGRHLDLTLNIVHGGITIDNNPEALEVMSRRFVGVPNIEWIGFDHKPHQKASTPEQGALVQATLFDIMKT